MTVNSLYQLTVLNNIQSCFKMRRISFNTSTALNNILNSGIKIEILMCCKLITIPLFYYK